MVSVSGRTWGRRALPSRCLRPRPFLIPSPPALLTFCFVWPPVESYPQQRPHSLALPLTWQGSGQPPQPCEAGHPHPPEMKVSILTGLLPLPKVMPSYHQARKTLTGASATGLTFGQLAVLVLHDDLVLLQLLQLGLSGHLLQLAAGRSSSSSCSSSSCHKARATVSRQDGAQCPRWESHLKLGGGCRDENPRSWVPTQGHVF